MTINVVAMTMVEVAVFVETRTCERSAIMNSALIRHLNTINLSCRVSFVVCTLYIHFIASSHNVDRLRSYGRSKHWYACTAIISMSRLAPCWSVDYAAAFWTLEICGYGALSHLMSQSITHVLQHLSAHVHVIAAICAINTAGRIARNLKGGELPGWLGCRSKTRCLEVELATSRLSVGRRVHAKLLTIADATQCRSCAMLELSPESTASVSATLSASLSCS